MTNKELIEKRIAELNKNGYELELTSYDKDVDKVSKKVLTKALKEFGGDSTDIKVMIRRKPYVLEIPVCDNEVDIIIYSLDEFAAKYGDEYLEAFED